MYSISAVYAVIQKKTDYSQEGEKLENSRSYILQHEPSTSERKNKMAPPGGLMSRG